MAKSLGGIDKDRLVGFSLVLKSRELHTTIRVELIDPCASTARGIDSVAATAGVRTFSCMNRTPQNAGSPAFPVTSVIEVQFRDFD